MASRAPADIVIFGASGDLAQRKVLPALGTLGGDGRLRVLGAGRSSLSSERFRDLVADASGSSALAAHSEWVRLDYDTPDSYSALKETLNSSKHPTVFYLATPPTTFTSILQGLTRAGLSERGDDRRIVVEKPLGQDAASARELNQQLRELFDESQIFRIDHYLAKDTVQNVLAFRFSNSLFEPVWDRRMIESIQITAAEDIDIGQRAGYYDRIGAMRDMIQNHVLQLLALVTMEPPTTFDPADIRTAKAEVLRAVQPLDPSTAVRGQYEGYLDAEGVAPDSRRETFAAARVVLENWRWEGVPIFIRSGKALRRQLTEVVIRLREAPNLRVGGRRQRGIPTLLVMRFQPDEGILLRIGAKRPGTPFEVVPAGMKLEYKRLSRRELPDAYVNVLNEILAGGHTVFPGAREIERSWEIVDPVIQSWEADGHPEIYLPGSWGPSLAGDLVAAQGGGRWITSGDEPGTS
ncbi:MAG: glucose-6-phosphate dehydrogenase [Candidatus Dormibacteraeota bacterium]|nr:glucose-6-phosphate dehydrogenase [Candidatus Dormibacteraeota bacterium]